MDQNVSIDSSRHIYGARAPNLNLSLQESSLDMNRYEPKAEKALEELLPKPSDSPVKSRNEFEPIDRTPDKQGSTHED